MLLDRKWRSLYSRVVALISLLSFLLSCVLPLCLLFLLHPLPHVLLLLLLDTPPHLLQTLTGLNPLRAADLLPVQALQANTRKLGSQSGSEHATRVFELARHAQRLWAEPVDSPGAGAERPPRTAGTPETRCRGSPPGRAPPGGGCASDVPRCSDDPQSSPSGPTSGGSRSLDTGSEPRPTESTQLSHKLERVYSGKSSVHSCRIIEQVSKLQSAVVGQNSTVEWRHRTNGGNQLIHRSVRCNADSPSRFSMTSMLFKARFKYSSFFSRPRFSERLLRGQNTTLTCCRWL